MYNPFSRKFKRRRPHVPVLALACIILTGLFIQSVGTDRGFDMVRGEANDNTGYVKEMLLAEGFDAVIKRGLADLEYTEESFYSALLADKNPVAGDEHEDVNDEK